MIRAKTHRYEDGRGGGDVSPLPDFSKSPLIITKKMISKTTQKRKKGKNSSALSSSSGISRSDQVIIINRNNSKSKPRNLKLSSSLGSLMAALPLSPSPVCSSPADSETIFSSPSSNLPCDYSRASGDFYTPTHQHIKLSMHTVVDSGVIHLMADYGFPIDNGAASLVDYHGARYFNRSMLLKDCGFQIEPSSVNFAQFHASLCRQVPDTHIQMKVENALLLLNECCKLVSDNLQDDVLVKRLDEFEFKAFRASIELEEMDKELSGCPVMMRAYATQELEGIGSLVPSAC